MDKLFQTALCLAWKERPFTDFLDLLDLQTFKVGLHLNFAEKLVFRFSLKSATLTI